MPDNTTSYGRWLVKTESDIEGRYLRDLGIFKGHLDEIARMLSEQCCYTLNFTRLPDKEPAPAPAQKFRAQVDIVLNINQVESIRSEALVQQVSKILSGRRVKVSPSNLYAAVKLEFDDTYPNHQTRLDIISN